MKITYENVMATLLVVGGRVTKCGEYSRIEFDTPQVCVGRYVLIERETKQIVACGDSLYEMNEVASVA